MQKHKSRGKKGSKGDKGTTEWVKRKKELYRTRGKADVPRDSKYVIFLLVLGEGSRADENVRVT